MAVSGRVYRLTPLAQADLESIWTYSAENWSPDRADSYISELMKAFTTLAAGGRRGRPVPERLGYLKYAVGSHLVFYRESHAAIDIVRVLHQRMDAEQHL
jgi:toxin ParE1/3/4